MSKTNKLNIIYLMSLRNATEDHAGQYISYKNSKQYMMSPLEYFIGLLKQELQPYYTLKSIIYDDITTYPADQKKLGAYNYQKEEAPWLFPRELSLPDGTLVQDLLHNVPSFYRMLHQDKAQRTHWKHLYEKELARLFEQHQADIILIDGLLLILNDLSKPSSAYHKKIINIHPGITEQHSPYQRRGAHATKDALYGAQGLKVTDWKEMIMTTAPLIKKTGASLHYINEEIDAGEVIYDSANTPINANDTLLELRYRNFQNSVFPVLKQGLLQLAQQHLG